MKKDDPFKYGIIVVDDYAPIRRLVKAIIETSPELAVIGEMDDAIALLKFLENSAAQLVVLDVSMPQMSGLEAARRIKQEHPEVKVLIVTIHKYQEYVERARSCGAEGYLLKEEIGDELLPAIASLRQGGTYFPSQILA